MKNIVFTGANKRTSVYDIYPATTDHSGHIFIFVHGYKGFKDWGAWSLMLEALADKGHTCYSFNFSHNGGTIDEPVDFPDLEAFAQNRYSYELFDLNEIVGLVNKKHSGDKIHLIAHSRGGGIALLVGATNSLVSSVFSLGAVSDFEARFPKGDALTDWREKGAYSVLNGRTNQLMTHNYSFYRDFVEHKSILNIKETLLKNTKPMFHIHGTNDEAVHYAESENIAKWSRGELWLLDGVNHTFNTKHPWEREGLSEELKKVVDYVDLNVKLL